MQRTLAVVETDNPYVTKGQLEGAEKGENSVTTVIEVVKDLQLIVGRFASVEGHTDEQVAAVAAYRVAWMVLTGAERGSGGSGWSGGDGEEARMARLLDAGAKYRAAQRALGMANARLVEAVCCEDMSLREASRVFEGGHGGAARERIEKRLLAAAEILATKVFGTVAGAGAKARLRHEGERPSVAEGKTYRELGGAITEGR